MCADCALQAQRAHADEQRKGMRMPLWLSLEPKPERLIGELRIIATRSRQCREELAAIPDDLSPMEVAMEALGIISRHADGCADELEALTADNARADDDGWKPTD